MGNVGTDTQDADAQPARHSPRSRIVRPHNFAPEVKNQIKGITTKTGKPCLRVLSRENVKDDLYACDKSVKLDRKPFTDPKWICMHTGDNLDNGIVYKTMRVALAVTAPKVNGDGQFRYEIWEWYETYSTAENPDTKCWGNANLLDYKIGSITFNSQS